MKISTMSFLSFPMLVAGSIALSGCGRSASNPTNISYRQVGICKGYETPAGPITAAANEGFAVFKIKSVDNTKYGSSFSLTPERLYVNQSTPAQAAGQVSNWNRRFVHPDPDSHRPWALRAFRKPLSRRAKNSTSIVLLSFPLALTTQAVGLKPISSVSSLRMIPGLKSAATNKTSMKV